MDLKEKRIRTLLQIAVLSDISDGLNKTQFGDSSRGFGTENLSGSVAARRTQSLINDIKMREPDLYQKLDLEHLTKSGRLGRRSSFNEDVYAKLGLDTIVQNSPSHLRINIRSLSSDLPGLATTVNGGIITDFTQQQQFLNRQGLGFLKLSRTDDENGIKGWPNQAVNQIENMGSSLPKTLSEKFSGTSQSAEKDPSQLSDIQRKFIGLPAQDASDTLTGNRSLSKKFQLPAPNNP